MTALATDQPVSAKRASQPRNDEAVRIRSEVAAKARIAAAFAGQSITDYLSNLLEPLLDKAIDDGYARTKKGTVNPKAKRSSTES